MGDQITSTEYANYPTQVSCDPSWFSATSFIKISHLKFHWRRYRRTRQGEIGRRSISSPMLAEVLAERALPTETTIGTDDLEDRKLVQLAHVGASCARIELGATAFGAGKDR
jgi:hypothetical protein